MDFKVLITESAIDDLKTIVEFVAEDDPMAAERLANKLVNYALSLGNFPMRNPIFDAARGIYKMTVPPYRIFYICDTSKCVVNILHFWHGARRLPDFR